MRCMREKHVDNIITNCYKQYNLFLTRFGKIASLVKSQLFVTYQCSFYGVILCDLKDIESVLVALRKCTRHIWNISPRTHSDILPHMTGICRHMSTNRFAKYYNNALSSKNDIIKYVFTADVVKDNRYRHVLINFRTSSHSLEIERGQYKTDIKERLYPYCMRIDDEKHFILNSDAIVHERQCLFNKIRIRYPNIST